MPQNPLAATVAINSAKQQATLRMGAGGASLLSSMLHGSMYEQSFAKNLFMGANPSAVTTSAALATTYVGLCLSNPANSGQNLVLRTVSGGLIAAPAALTGFNLITGFLAAGITVHTTALTPISTLIGSGDVSAAHLDSACTLVGTPAWTLPLAETPAATSVVFFSQDLQGAVILQPGAYAAIGTTIAGPATGFMGGFQWEEAPIAG
jgi:hypothetical protein